VAAVVERSQIVATAVSASSSRFA